MKHVRMVIYGEPGTGKSVFACKAPKPFFITTDPNYEYLEPFGAKDEDHIQVRTWAEAKKAFNQSFDGYDTIVIDLLEDLFKWCEYEYCKVNGYEHVSDVGFAKGYDITRNDFFINICKVLNLQKNVILIMHGYDTTTKDRRGIEHTKHIPTNRLPDKVLDMIEGRVRYFLRAYSVAEDVEGKLVTKRYLSLVPKENEYGIARGLDENNVPSDIPLDFNTFANAIGLEIEKPVETKKLKRKEPEVVVKDIKTEPVEVKVEEKPVEEKVEITGDLFTEPVVASEPVKEESKPVEKPAEKPLDSKAKMLAELKAKMLAMQNKK